MKVFKKYITGILILVLMFQGFYFRAWSYSAKGYISNKIFNPLKLKVFKIDNGFSYYSEINLDDNTVPPKINMKLTAENNNDYSFVLNDKEVFIPALTKFSGQISEITTPKRFNRRGLFKVVFDSAICPSGETIYLKDKIVSTSHTKSYNPFSHVGKTTLNLLGGSLAGTLFSYQLGGLGLAVATHGYSLATGAAVGGFVGTVGGIFSEGKVASLEAGTELLILPVDEVSIRQLEQVVCKNDQNDEPSIITENRKDIEVEILSTKQKNDILGEHLLSISVKVQNNSNENYRLNNFYLRDSQGKEYSTSLVDFNDESFENLQSNQVRVIKLDFYVDHPKASHWLILKNKTLSKNIGEWKVNFSS